MIIYDVYFINYDDERLRLPDVFAILMSRQSLIDDFR